VTRFALAVVLSLSVSCLASAQRQNTSGSSSSSPSSSSSGGYSGGSSGGGGTHHSSGSSSGSSSDGGGSGGYSGGTHSSASSNSNHSGGYSGGVSSGSASTTSSQSSSRANTPVGASGSVSRGSSTGNSAARDNFSNSSQRLGIIGREPKRIGAGSSGTEGRKSSQKQVLSGSVRPDSIPNQAWMHQDIHLPLPPQTLDKRTWQQVFAERVRAVGLEINKSAYKSATLDPESHHASWFGKLFNDKRKPTKSRLRLLSLNLDPALGRNASRSRVLRSHVCRVCKATVSNSHPRPQRRYVRAGSGGPTELATPGDTSKIVHTHTLSIPWVTAGFGGLR
jgi:hypothetical protein